jgi:hypothetical protein
LLLGTEWVFPTNFQPMIPGCNKITDFLFAHTHKVIKKTYIFEK